MKLAPLKHGCDGKLVVVSRDLTKATSAAAIAPTLQAALDSWAEAAARLAALADQLARDAVPLFAFREQDCAAPLPRAYQWLDGSAYLNHVGLGRKARGAEMPPNALTDPLMYQGSSDAPFGPRDPILLADEAYGADMEVEVAVIAGDVPMNVSADEAGQAIRLVMLANDVSLRNLIPAELAKGFGFLQSKAQTAFSPVAATLGGPGGGLIARFGAEAALPDVPRPNVAPPPRPCRQDKLRASGSIPRRSSRSCSSLGRALAIGDTSRSSGKF